MSKISCDRCVFCGELYYKGFEDIYEDTYECRWPGDTPLPPSLRLANRERETVNPSDALHCAWFKAKATGDDNDRLGPQDDPDIRVR